MADTRVCNRCNSPSTGVCSRCGCPEFRVLRDPQRRLWPLVLLVLLAGCRAAASSGLPLEERVAIGVAMAMAVVQEPAAPGPAPAPPPAPPRPGSVCPECEGRGRVSRDGTVWSKCLPCNGTGKVQGNATAVTPKTRTVYRQVCDPKTGRCTLIPETETLP